MAKETIGANLRKHRCFVFGITWLAHEASRHVQYNLMNLLGRSQIDYLTIASAGSVKDRLTVVPRTVEQEDTLLNIIDYRDRDYYAQKHC